MERSADIEMIREQWKRIIALLLGLAALADRACGAPLPVSILVMSFLLPAESVAREFVAGEVGLPSLLLAHPDDDDADAARLAASFRALSIVLVGAVARLGKRCRVRHDVHPPRRAGHAADVVNDTRSLVVRALRPFDTS